ncbi:hypothetical protein CEXT_118911 [Caerostris extrusa]|uniref:Uncharacterized protein n=1 Tax=Caerostris extrusa TaxID=172846 RepID=A0AAV4Y2P4_CAEEX|nr:hypothetical protein CEXT_118911 [Caerostris extrusa]
MKSHSSLNIIPTTEFNHPHSFPLPQLQQIPKTFLNEETWGHSRRKESAIIYDSKGRRNKQLFAVVRTRRQTPGLVYGPQLWIHLHHQNTNTRTA